MPRLQVDLELEQIRRANSRSINSMRFLFLALNDVVAFEREVLETGKNYPQELQLHANPTTQGLSGLDE
jgi:hypothetical protein